MSDLLHSALLRSQLQSTNPSLTATQLSTLSLSNPDSDDELIPVRTPLPTSPNSAASSRASSPTRASTTGLGGRTRSGAGKPRRDKTKEGLKKDTARFDPLSRFPGEVNVRIFGVMEREDLLSCGLVCKKWRKSQTINWVWHCLLESVTWDPSSSSLSPNSASSLPTWRRGDSKLDWAARYASIYSQDPLAIKESEVDEDGKTFQEEREEKWKEENEEAERQSNDKSVQRDYYKSLGNSKIKGKTGKGMAKTWEADGLGGGGDDYI